MEQCEEGQLVIKDSGLTVPDKALGKAQYLRVPRKNKALERTEEGCLILNDHNLLILCETDGLYEFPQMNTKLYLHYKVIDHLCGLQKYINLKTLYLQNNVIRKIQNLGHLTQLQNLFLQSNMIRKMEGLQNLKALKVLNLANNTIFAIEGLDECRMLQSLTLAHNYLSNFESIEHLGQCSLTLTSIDLTQNKLNFDQRMFDLIAQVKLLYLGSNPLVREMNHYRRTVIGKLPALMYLDQRGVDPEERMMAEAFVKQGEAGFRAARQKVMSLRKQKRLQAKQQIMASIDVHRKKKINVFQGNIIDAEKQIEKLRGYMREPGNEDQIYFYESQIADLMQKIRENQEFIDSIYKRMGMEPPPPVYSLELDPLQKEQITQQQMREGGMFEIQQEPEETPSEGQSESNSQAASLQSRHSQVASLQSASSSQPQSSSSQQSSLQTYYSYDELD